MNYYDCCPDAYDIEEELPVAADAWIARHARDNAEEFAADGRQPPECVDDLLPHEREMLVEYLMYEWAEAKSWKERWIKYD